jgi:hypothetical protein
LFVLRSNWTLCHRALPTVDHRTDVNVKSKTQGGKRFQRINFHLGFSLSPWHWWQHVNVDHL